MYKHTEENVLDLSTNDVNIDNDFGHDSSPSGAHLESSICDDNEMHISFEKEEEKMQTSNTNKVTRRHEASDFVYLRTFESQAEFDEFRQIEKCWSCDGISWMAENERAT